MRLFALLIICVSFTVRADAQVTLQFKLVEGDVIRQVMTQEMTSASKVQGRDISTEMKQLMHLEQRIGEVAENGSAQVLQEITRMQMSMKLPIGQPFEYDSEGENEEASEEVATDGGIVIPADRNRVVRGGSFYLLPVNIRSANRAQSPPSDRIGNLLGLRPVRTMP